MANTFFGDGSEVIKRIITTDLDEINEFSDEDFNDIYEIKKCVSWINSQGFKRVGLQFPDELLCHSIQILNKLQLVTNSFLFIVGDSSYGSCCVDEIGAEHANADALIHYGRSCLTFSLKLPVLYVFGKSPANLQNCFENFQKAFIDLTSKIILIGETIYQHLIELIYENLKDQYTNMRKTFILLPNEHCCIEKHNHKNYKEHIYSGRAIYIPEEDSISQYTFFYVGSQNFTYSHLSLIFNKNKFVLYDPVLESIYTETIATNRVLMKRLYLIEKAKDANIVGILVGTLGINKYLDIISYLKNVIKKSGKKSFCFAMGKLNVAKLANFAEIDIFVIVSCPENSFINSTDFYRPIVTPYEMDIACNTSRSWSADYVADFRELLPGQKHHISLEQVKEVEPDVSLITGKMRYSNLSHCSTDETGISLKNENSIVSSLPTAQFLQDRIWNGLDSKLGETEVEKVKEGRSGISTGYSHELNN